MLDSRRQGNWFFNNCMFIDLDVVSAISHVHLTSMPPPTPRRVTCMFRLVLGGAQRADSACNAAVCPITSSGGAPNKPNLEVYGLWWVGAGVATSTASLMVVGVVVVGVWWWWWWWW